MSKRSHVEGDFDDAQQIAGVEPIEGETFRFLVASRSGGEPYLVDLEGYWFNGWCGCMAFATKCEPRLSRGEKPAARLRCWHINRARDYFFLCVAPKLKKAIDADRISKQK